MVTNKQRGGTIGLTDILAIIKKDAMAEWRQKHSLFGVLLYVGATVFMVYSMNGTPEAKVWNALFWMTQLFVSVNAVAKSFLQESVERSRYYYLLVSARTFIIAKLIYNLLLQSVVSLMTLGLFLLMMGNPLMQTGRFFVVCLLGGTALSSVFTFISAIASKANRNASLMAILGFPILTPILLMLSKLSAATVMPVYQASWGNLAAVLALLSLLVVTLSLILFPFLWKE